MHDFFNSGTPLLILLCVGFLPAIVLHFVLTRRIRRDVPDIWAAAVRYQTWPFATYATAVILGGRIKNGTIEGVALSAGTLKLHRLIRWIGGVTMVLWLTACTIGWFELV